MLIERTLQKHIEKSLFKGKIIVLYGARQVGKTTLVKAIQEKYSDEAEYLNCDEPDVKDALTDKTSTQLKNYFGKRKLIIIDEAQRVRNIGLTLKLIADNISNVQIIATGSSSFELSNKIIEPLTGRKTEFSLFPFSLQELSAHSGRIEMNRLLEKRIITGMYPGVIIQEGSEDAIIKEIAKSYSFKDIFRFQNIKNPDILEKLLQALALQVGNEVSYTELASLLNIDKNTVDVYVRLLEQAFIIFRLRPFSRNLRNELKKLRKIYFYDTGIRNALINNLNPLHLRTDKGALWENFLISERIKNLKNNGKDRQIYFWRTQQQQEIDYLEEEGGKLGAFEIKWKKEKIRVPKTFTRAYPDCKVSVINRDNFWNFCGK